MAKARGAVAEGTLRLTPGENVDALALHVGDVPFGASDARIVVGGDEVFAGPVASLGTTLSLVRTSDGWRTGFPPQDGLRKRPGLSGPISDAYLGRMIHVYGTRNADHTEDLREAAQRGARGWPLWSWDLTQEVVADTELTEEMMENAHVVLYGSPGDNAVLERVAGALPIRLEEGAVVVGDERFTGNDVGVRFIYPNPLAPERYLIVQAGVTPRAVKKGNELPEFVPDFMVYDDDTVAGPQRRTTGPKPVRAMGFFDDRWQLPGASEEHAEGAGPDQGDTTTEAEEEPSLPVPPAPPVPEPPRRFHAPRSDQAGLAARRIARIVPSFENYRAEIGGAEWELRRRAVWSIGPTETCLEELQELEVEARPRPEPHPLTPSPVEILGPVDGVWFRMTHEEQPLVVSCEMAKRLPTIVGILKDYGIHGVEILSAHRDYPRTSFHRMGLALDLMRFWTDEGWLSVEDHYQATPMQPTCGGPRPRDRRARRLRAIACRLWATEAFSSVLTPNYNEGHRDHFHLDARPDDPRLFLR